MNSNTHEFTSLFFFAGVVGWEREKKTLLKQPDSVPLNTLETTLSTYIKMARY